MNIASVIKDLLLGKLKREDYVRDIDGQVYVRLDAIRIKGEGQITGVSYVVAGKEIGEVRLQMGSATLVSGSQLDIQITPQPLIPIDLGK